MRLLNELSNRTVRVFGLTLSPDKQAGDKLPTSCPCATPACLAVCTGTTGAGSSVEWPAVLQVARKTTLFLRMQPTAFRQQLNAEIEYLRAQCEREHVQLVVVLNVASDIRFESSEYGEIPQKHPDVQFFDVTRDYSRVSLPNYRLIHRLGEDNDRQCRDILTAGGEVCAVFAEPGSGFLGAHWILQRLPRRMNLAGLDITVVDGDQCKHWPPEPKEREGYRWSGDSDTVPQIIGYRFRVNSAKARNAAIDSGIVR